MTNGTRGRAAEARVNDQALLDAARIVFAVHGPEAPVSAVAAAAGVGIGSLYRRHQSKEALLQFLCLESLQQVQAIGERALEQSDPWTALTSFVFQCVAVRTGAFATIAGSFEATREMWVAAQRGQRLISQLVDRARTEGVIRADVTGFDIHLLIEMFSRRREDDGGAHQRLVVIALDGLAATGPCTELRGEAPGWANIARGWQRG